MILFVECIIVCLLSIVLLYQSSRSFRYHFRFFIYYTTVAISCIILLPIILLRPWDCRNILLISYFCRRISPLFGLKWELRGRMHLAEDRACVVVSNHQSSLDILGMFNIWDVMVKCTVITNRELFFAWPFGLVAWLCGLFYIDRFDTYECEAWKISKIKREKIKLWFFPEGAQRNTGEIHPFKKEAFHMAVKGQIPILPVVFSSYQPFLDTEKRIINKGKIKIICLHAVSTDGLSREDIPRLMEMVRKIMSDTFKSSSRVASRTSLEDDLLDLEDESIQTIF